MRFSNIFIPDELIASEPLLKRDECRLLCLEKNTGNIKHMLFKDVVEFFKDGDLLVFNNTKVVNARLYVSKTTGGAVEILLLRPATYPNWRCLIKGKNIKKGTILKINDTDILVEVSVVDDGHYEVKFPDSTDVLLLMEKVGQIPLPPYIKRDPVQSDYEMYQTVFAKEKGSVASPTASLHFTDDLINKIKDKGVSVHFVTLHVGYGTFSPVRDPDTHVMHEEFFSFDKNLEGAISKCKNSGGRVWAVGTTVVRTLESAFDDDLHVERTSGWSNLFIKEPYKFKVIDCMITNFHHPSTSLMYLVSAFAGEDRIIKSYNDAVSKKYRMLSYGDAMAIIR